MGYVFSTNSVKIGVKNPKSKSYHPKLGLKPTLVLNYWICSFFGAQELRIGRLNIGGIRFLGV